MLVVALALTARMLAARGAYLMPDEALHLRVAGASTLAETYRSSRATAHPPLFMFLLHFWKPVAASEWQSRLLPVAIGGPFLWAAYRWVRRLFGTSAALAALVLLAFLPSLVLLSAELRGYALLLWLTAAALGALERALQTRSPLWMAVYGILAGLALLSHYAAVWFIAAAFVYAAARLRGDRPPGRVVAAWAASEAFLAALLVFLYVTHVSRLHGGALETEARNDWLRTSYFHPEREGALEFLGRQTLALFQYFFSTRVGGVLALALFLGAVAWLAVKRQPSAILLALPFLLAAATGLADVYPYGGTRHAAGLTLFAAAGVGCAVTRLSGNRLWIVLLLFAVLVPAGFAVGW
jgi:uncharacterized membrane protein